MLRILTLIGALFLALLGAASLFIAIVGFNDNLSREEEMAPTPLALSDFEKDGKFPADKRWLEFTDGVLLWSEVGIHTRVWKLKRGNKEFEFEFDRAVFVPLVSKKAFDIGQKSKDDLKQPIQVARVYVRFKPGVVGAELPLQETDVDHRPKLHGLVATLAKEPGFLREGMAPKGSLKDPAKLLVVRYNESRAPRSVSPSASGSLA
jgi:hypothetical protein